MMGNVVNLFLKPGRKQPMLPVADVIAIEGEGLKGDASFGRSMRQILMVESEVLDRYALLPGSVRENITTRGVRLRELSAGTRLRLGEALLEVIGDCTPCSFLDSLRPGLQERINGERGVLARVITNGTIRVGDSITLVD